MTPFLAAQVADPFDPVPMLIQADWLEERGDLAGAAVLRGLAGNGTPSMVAMSWGIETPSAGNQPDNLFDHSRNLGWGQGDGYVYPYEPGEFGDGHLADNSDGMIACDGSGWQDGFDSAGDGIGTGQGDTHE